MSSCLTQDLNTSDHLPLTVSLMYDTCSMTDVNASQGLLKIDWNQARKVGAIDEFVKAVQTWLATFLNNLYGNIQETSEEIEKVAGLITNAAEKVLPHVQPRRPGGEITACVRRVVQLGGHGRMLVATQVPLCEEEGRSCKAVRRRVRFCAAWADHFSGLCKGRGDDLLGLKELKHRMEILVLEPNRNE